MQVTSQPGLSAAKNKVVAAAGTTLHFAIVFIRRATLYWSYSHLKGE